MVIVKVDWFLVWLFLNSLQVHHPLIGCVHGRLSSPHPVLYSMLFGTTLKKLKIKMTNTGTCSPDYAVSRAACLPGWEKSLYWISRKTNTRLHRALWAGGGLFWALSQRVWILFYQTGKIKAKSNLESYLTLSWIPLFPIPVKNDLILLWKTFRK